MVSLMVGLVRNCFNIVYSLPETYIVDELLGSINYNTIKHTINKVDYDKASKIYHESIIDFLNSPSIKDTSIILSKETQRNTLEKMIQEGFQSVFRPYRMRQLWERFSNNRYGFSTFSAYINNPNSKLLYKNYTKT